MAKFIEVLKDGLTVQGRVTRAGQRVQVKDEFNALSKKAQVDRWGVPRYREISRADFEGTGGEVKGEEPEADAPVANNEEAAVEPVADENPYAEFDGLNAEDTLALAAGLDESELAGFIAYEMAGANRKTVLDALGAGGE